MLLLKKHLVALVRSGQKRQTLRFWTHPMVKAGQITFAPGLGHLRIDSIEELPNLQALTESDARADGFENLPALLAELTQIYGPNPVNKRLYRLTFTWPIEKPQPLAAPQLTPPKNRMTPAQRLTLKNYILCSSKELRKSNTACRT